MALAEVSARLNDNQEGADADELHHLVATLDLWLERDDERRMRGFHDDSRGCGACMCSIERLEDRAKRGD